MKRLVVAMLLAACGSPAAPHKPTGGSSQPAAEKTLVNVDDKGVGLGGHDPVSYTKGAPVAGSADHAASHGGATYHFATAEDKTAFEGDKTKFAPGYGGYCAFAAAQNRLSKADPKVFHLHDGHLLVFTNDDYKTKFMADPAGNKAKADANWPGLVAKHGK
jgi:YHS domain-containing protein